jgi:hypothetical protein
VAICRNTCSRSGIQAEQPSAVQASAPTSFANRSDCSGPALEDADDQPRRERIAGAGTVNDLD